MLRFTILILFFYSATAIAHGGGLDKTGGHHNRKTGEYHCHREPCLSNHSRVRDATEEAEQEGYSYSRLYNRDEWGRWIDEDGDCQDTRAEILIRDSIGPVSFKSERQCIVTSGLWHPPYSGGTLTNARQLDIDHIIPLKWAHGHGGDRWTVQRKREFANDPDNLLATWSSANRSKGSKGPDQWMPAIYQCKYAKQWQLLIEKYELIAVGVEVDALNRACD
jgi:hypothetical protein